MICQQCSLEFEEEDVETREYDDENVDGEVFYHVEYLCPHCFFWNPNV